MIENRISMPAKLTVCKSCAVYLKWWLIYIIVCIVILSGEVTSASSGQKPITSVILNSSTLIDGKYACPGQNVTFTCRVTGGTSVLIMNWQSDHDQYIDTNQPLQFTDECEVSDTVTQGKTVATLTEVDRNGRIVESQLQLIASPDIPTACIVCSILTDKAKINFTLLEIPNKPRNVTASITSCDQHPGGGCEVNVRWHSPTNTESSIMHYVIIEFPHKRSTTTDGSETHVVLHIKDSVDLDNKTISILAVDSCGREGPVSSPFNLSNLFVESTTHFQTTGEIITSSTPSSNGQLRTNLPTVIGALLGVLLLIAAVALAVIIAIIIKVRMKGSGARGLQKLPSDLDDTHSGLAIANNSANSSTRTFN